MALEIYNVLSGNKEPFKPVEAGKAKIYVCGVTVYGRCHIGHLRCYLSFDAVVRYLVHKGLDVQYVRNFTDIDDKIIMRAKEIEAGPGGQWTKKDAYSDFTDEQWNHRFAEDEVIRQRAGEQGKHLSEVVADFFIDVFTNEDFAPFDLYPASSEPRVSQHIPDVIELIEKIVSNGFGYESGGDVYFDVEAYHKDTGNYGKLSRRNFEEMQSGARVAVGDKKKNGADFALWKSAQPGEPSWESPWGKGRPGWHIECSAMSDKVLGTPFDIHGGGKDLIFPHHENEIAQSEAGLGHAFCNTWVHNGFVTVNGTKMSKSLGNFLSIQEALQMAPPEVWRLLVLGSHYTSPIDCSITGGVENTEENIRGTVDISFERLEYFYESLERADQIVAQADVAEGVKPANDVRLSGLGAKFEAAMDDDFNSARALAAVGESMKYLNELCDMKAKQAKKFDGGKDGWRETIRQVAVILREVCAVLNICQRDPREALDEMTEHSLKALGIAKSAVVEKLAERDAARADKDFARSDAVRDEIIKMGIELRDSPTGTVWKVARK